jgi:hypothetical protein
MRNVILFLAVLLRIQVFWDVMSPGTFYRLVEELYCPRLQFQAFQNVELEPLILRQVGNSLPVRTV